ncbi:MAG: zinc-dependent alcohol dehydrogenase family protein [Thermoproteota archaeon]
MKAMVLEDISPVESKPLRLKEIPISDPEGQQVLVNVSACGVCHTELDEIEGRLHPTKLPIVLGHEIVGRVEKVGSKVSRYKKGDRVGVTWLNWACGECSFCLEGRENLCPEARWTGKDVDGGYAQYTVVSEDFAYPIPDRFKDSEAAPLLCGGVIGYRALRLTGLKDGKNLGLYGFGSSAHIVIQVARYRYPNSKVFVFTRSQAHRDLAEELGAYWTGRAEDDPPEKVDCSIDFTPVGSTVREALRVLQKGGRVVINAIRKIDNIPELNYHKHLWHEKELKSVANVTSRDAEEFLPLAAEIPITPKVQHFPMEKANQALILLKEGKIQGSGVLDIPQ